ncbi:MAG TPA: hypothetical protein PLK90_11105 [Clostridiales bacterium]|nr:hypothetical protein [Clostridiales bacterium]HQP70936.1 hypothetical protein [Clostridiales bacterium]
MRKCWLVIIFFLIVSLQAQDSMFISSDRQTWLGIGPGLGSINSAAHQSTVFGMNFNHASSGYIYKARYLYLHEIVMNIMGDPPPADDVWETGLLFGFSSRKEDTIVSLSAGISHVGGVRHEFVNLLSGYKYDKIDISTVGLPVEAQAVFSFSQSVGMSVILFGDFNSENKIFGAQFCLIIGKLG